MNTIQREALEQALNAIYGTKLCAMNSMSSRFEMIRLLDKATSKLREALDQPATTEQSSVVDQQPAAVIGFYEGEREPRLLSWNRLPDGEHWLYTHPPEQSSLHLGLSISEGRLHTSLMRREANSHMTVLNISVVDVDHLNNRDYIISLEAK